jgi:hypothetical protein
MSRYQWLEMTWRAVMTAMILIMFVVVAVHVANCP